MANADPSSELQTLLVLGMALLTCALVGVMTFGSTKADSWKKRGLLVLLSSGLGFLFGASMSAYMLIDSPDYRALPLLLLFSLFWASIGATVTFVSVWASQWWRKRGSSTANGEVKANNEI